MQFAGTRFVRAASALGRRCALAALAPFVLLLAGCYHVPEGRTAIDTVKVEVAEVPNTKDSIDTEELREKIATAPSPKLFGLFRGVVYDYTFFDRSTLQRDLARAEAFCRARGYYDAHARAGVVRYVSEKHVQVEITVEPGEPVRVAVPTIEGIADLPEDVIRLSQRAVKNQLRVDEPFDEDLFAKAKETLARALTDRGFAFAKVTSAANVDLVTKKATATFHVEPGPETNFGEVLLDGLGGLPDAQVRAVIDLHVQRGERYSTQNLDDVQQAILDMGVFSTVDVEPLLDKGPREDGQVDVRIHVEPSKLHTVRAGVGLEFDSLRADVHGLLGWEHRNFLGRFRTFSIETRPGLVFYPLRVNNFVAPTDYFPENRLKLEVRERNLFGTRIAGFVRPQFDVYPVLITPNPVENAPVLGYAEQRHIAGIDALYGRVYTALSHTVQVAYPFSYAGGKDPNLSLIVISYPELTLQLDLRDNRVHPRKGMFLSGTAQVAGGPFGGDAVDFKLQPEVRGYVPVGRRVVLAARAALGFLFADANSYGTAVQGDPRILDGPTRTKDYQLTFFRGLFSGGPNSNRGYAPRAISPYGNVGFLSPQAEQARLDAGCVQDCRVPTGGFTQWEASLEARILLAGPLSMALFCDAADVAPQMGQIRPNYLHLSCGAGGRYDTPVGPIRLDIGYRIPGAQVIGTAASDQKEQPLLLGMPIAVAIGIGEAF
ncbi:MAG: BamA/TamA family outer membrane protein [Polyangiaceae bacterium]